MNYLKYIEYSAENLQFFLWYRDYSARWESLKDVEKSLAPEWTVSAEADHTVSTSRPKRVAPEIAQVLSNSEFGHLPKVTSDRADPFNTPPQSLSFEDKREVASDNASSVSDEKTLLGSANSNHRALTEQAFDEAGLKWKPCMFHKRDVALFLVVPEANKDQSPHSHIAMRCRGSSASISPMAALENSTCLPAKGKPSFTHFNIRRTHQPSEAL